MTTSHCSFRQHHNIHVSADWLARVLHVLSVLRSTADMALLALINHIFGTCLGDYCVKSDNILDFVITTLERAVLALL